MSLSKQLLIKILVAIIVLYSGTDKLEKLSCFFLLVFNFYYFMCDLKKKSYLQANGFIPFLFK